MQLATTGTFPSSVSSPDAPPDPVSPNKSLEQFKVVRRNGSVVPFEPTKITIAMTKAFIAVNGGQGAASARVRELVDQLTDNVVNALMRRQPHGGRL